MYIVNNYLLAVVLCFVTMLCWGSWANTQKLAGKTWRYELFYWDYVIGILLFSIVLGFSLGSVGDAGRSFLDDLGQITFANMLSAFIGGALFNLANILLSAAVSMAGLTVAFPLGVGIALVLGVFVNYFGEPKGDPVTLFFGVALVMIAIILNAMASSRMSRGERNNSKKGAMVAVVAGVLMSFFYRFVAAAMDLNNFEFPTPGMATPYSAFFIFAVGIFISNFLFNTIVMRGIFQRKHRHTHGGCTWRCHLGLRNSSQLHCRRQSRRSYFVCAGTGSTYGGCTLGHTNMERVQRRTAECEYFACLHVHTLHIGTRSNNRLRRQLTNYLEAFIATLLLSESPPSGGVSFVRVISISLMRGKVAKRRSRMRPATCSNRRDFICISSFTTSYTSA